ncbi:F-box protein PP2-B15-like [Mercurialis annua]|uniref:F-box protein PP2-B15-like n=1 Tax=Mercurialis annua TaxID=3986 RepID=UPI00215E1C2A|nr:F-box protein PP2-B15-like [Mercurialis annua]
MLPEDCVSTILSFTSPVDVCRSSLVSSTFRSAMESDIVWERFLPSDYLDILSRLVTPFIFSSRKELFLHLSDPVLIDGGKTGFKLEKSSGKKSYILSARELSITWSDVPTYWCWVPKTESRFSEVAVLRTTSWLEIRGKIRTQKLSPNTRYGAYLIMKISNNAYGLDSIPSEITVEVGNTVSSGSTYLHNQQNKVQSPSCLDNIEDMQMPETNLKMQVKMPRERDDTWSEIELGEFFSGEGDEEVKMSLIEVKGCQLKGGLVIEGIEIRPK